MTANRRMRHAALCTVGVLLGAVAPARGGDGPLYTPVGAFIDGKPARNIWTVVGVVKRLGIVTAVSCTSLEVPGTVADIGVEFFDEAGTQLNSVGAAEAPGTCNGSVRNIPAGSSVTIASGATAQFHEDCIAGVSTFAGSARIVSTTSKIACTAQIEDAKSVILDANGNPTGRTPAVSRLTLVKRNKQAGD